MFVPHDVSPKRVAFRYGLAYVTVNIVFEVGIIVPQYCIDTRREDLQQRSDTKEGDAKIPVLTNEASQEDEKHHRRSKATRYRERRIGRVDCRHAREQVSVPRN